ncbi:hypothetical protein K08M4_08170 [Vibrio syngnathi]|uniref:Uncharacterized protein n=1 Tax=Vibrio syngnathi TaxID=3034029 RepID=A0AA34TMF4_9VIBR|nr:hypothetical protein K08M4_08170 [Vibrio syngnathi]
MCSKNTLSIIRVTQGREKNSHQRAQIGMLLIQRVMLFFVKQMSKIEVLRIQKIKIEDWQENKNVEVERKKPLFL